MNRRNRFSVTLISATLLGMLTCSTATSAKNPKNSKPTTPDVTSIKIGNVTLKGIPYDYSWTHVVFPDPGSEENAIRNGTHDRWLKIVNDPRYIIQQLHRGQPVRGPNAAEVAAFEKYVRKNNTLASRVTPKAPLAGAQESTKKAPAKIEGASPKGKSAIASTPQVAAQSKAGSAGAVADWQVGMEGSGGSGTGVDGISPNTAGVSYTNSIGAPSCSADWEAFVTGQYTTSTPLQASIVGFNNLYSTCSGSIPSVLFAYEIETSDGVMLEAQSSPVISYYDSGQQLAFIATDRTAQQSYLVLLQWEGSSMEPSGTLASPTVLSPFPPRRTPAAAVHRAILSWRFPIPAIPYPMKRLTWTMKLANFSSATAPDTSIASREFLRVRWRRTQGVRGPLVSRRESSPPRSTIPLLVRSL